MLDQVLASQAVAHKVVIVDDYYATPTFELVDAAALSELYSELDGKIARQRELAKTLGLAKRPKTLQELMTLIEANYPNVWNLYRGGLKRHEYLRALFEKVEDSKRADKPSLDEIGAFFRKKNIETENFESLEAAGNALSECVIAFIDFRLKPGLSTKAALAQHREYAEKYRGEFKFNGAAHPKIVYLISSALPNTSDLQAFRAETGIKTAFFRSFPKSDVTSEMLETELSRWTLRYTPAAKLHTYLKTVSAAIESAAQEVSGIVDGLELHDLALLNVFKLTAESQSLQSYLNWLLAESFGSKLRGSPSLQPVLLPEEVPFAPMDGKIKLGATLFDLFSMIAVSDEAMQSGGTEFGDVFVRVTERTNTRPRDVLLAISPACDLARCEPEYEVLCVRGRESVAKRDSNVLLENEKGLFGDGRYLVGYNHESKRRYALLDWASSVLTTIKARDLSDATKYQRIARLSELFAHEVKTRVLSNASRVGIQTYPTLTLSTQAHVSMKFGAVTMEIDASDQQFQCVVVVKGRTDQKKAGDARYAVFTEQFVEWVRKTFLKSAESRFTGAVPTKFTNVKTYFGQPTNIHLDLKTGTEGSECGGVLRVSIVEDLNRLAAQTKEGFEISVVLPLTEVTQEN